MRGAIDGGYHRRMSDHDDLKTPFARRRHDLREYLKTCAMIGVEPVTVERARESIGEWTRAIAAATAH